MPDLQEDFDETLHKLGTGQGHPSSIPEIFLLFTIVVITFIKPMYVEVVFDDDGLFFSSPIIWFPQGDVCHFLVMNRIIILT